MVKILFRLYFLLAVFTILSVECKGGRGGRGGRGGHGSHGSHSSRGGHSSSHGSHSSSGGHSSHVSSSSGGGSQHTYPSNSGYSGYGTGGSHGYPSSHGLSGSSSSNHVRSSSAGGYVYRVPNYYTAPQHVYVTEYRNSNSRYNDILTGLTLYNMGRSHNHYHHSYYHDAYYRRSSNSKGGSATSSHASDQAEVNATCLMRIKETGKEQALTIPCAIISTFNDSTQETAQKTDNKTETNNKISTDAIDPIHVKGAPLNTSDMKCSVEIITAVNIIKNDVDCNVLLQYANMPIPENKQTIVMPSRGKLESMLKNPPWWASLFFAV